MESTAISLHNLINIQCRPIIPTPPPTQPRHPFPSEPDNTIDAHLQTGSTSNTPSTTPLTPIPTCDSRSHHPVDAYDAVSSAGFTMPSTRFPSLQIFQDPVASFDHVPMPSSQNANYQQKKSPLRPIKNAASRRNIVLNPPQSTGPSKQSPLKSAHHSSSPNRPFGSKLNLVPMPPPGGSSHNTDSMQKKQPLMSKFKPQKALFTTFSSAKGAGSAEKENYPTSIYPQPAAQYNEGFNRSNFSLEGLFGQRPTLKRSLMEAAPIHDSRPSKKSKVEEDGEDILIMQDLPAPDSFPPIKDDGSKPPHSYAQLIAMSILRSEGRRLTLAQIYKWISDTYAHYGATDAGWQNSIRHNLSLNKAFVKQERPKDDPGKGNYWALVPGMEHIFMKEKMAKKALNEGVSVASNAIPSMELTPIAPLPSNQSEPSRTNLHPLLPALPQILPRQNNVYSLPDPPKPRNEELSSDATIPASDISNTDPAQEEEAERAPPSSPLMHSSPPTALIHSSPPVPRHVQRRQDTPPPVPRFPSSSRSRSHKRKFASMDDSGYFSNLDSSAMRYNPHRLLTSEADRPRMKRGRAEEEIARLRGSSYDSPTKGRMLQPSSSPMRRSLKTTSQMLPPLTPAMKLKAPVRPPPSVSPNTNLRLHRDRVREMVGSPLRDMTCLGEDQLPWSPQFNIDNSTPFVYHDGLSDFDIFADPGTFHMGTLDNPFSPEKRSSKRPRLDRSRSANLLAEMSQMPNSLVNQTRNLNGSNTPALKFTPSAPKSHPFSLSPPKSLSSFFDSPSLHLESPSKMTNSSAYNLGNFEIDQDFFESEFLEEGMGFDGVDIMQGFQKIGSGTAPAARNTSRPGSSRPALGRSFSTRF